MKKRIGIIMSGVMAVCLCLQSCSDELPMTARLSEAELEKPENVALREESVLRETYFTDLNRIEYVLEKNVYYVFFSDNFGPQQIAAIKFDGDDGVLSTTWTDASGQYTGFGTIIDGKINTTIDFGSGKSLTFGLLRVVDNYANSELPYDVFFDKVQITKTSNLKYIVSNAKYFDQVDPISRDKKYAGVALDQTQWSQIDFGVPPGLFEFRYFQGVPLFEYFVPGYGLIQGTYTSDGYTSRVVANDDEHEYFNLQVASIDYENLMLSVEKKNGQVTGIKKFKHNKFVVF